MREEESSTRRTEDTPRAAAKRALVLRGLLHGDRTLAELVGDRLVLGRGRSADVRLDYERISREHAEIQRHGPLFTVRDLGSTNGTYLDGKRIELSPLRVGALLRVGDWLGVVDDGDGDASADDFRELAEGTWGGKELAQALLPLKRLNGAKLPVLLVGETGTGKERFARAIHAFGAGGRPFHAINCAALPPTLVEAELFGYRKGAFTGADRAYSGQLRAAHGGTLFLDEVTDLPLSLQGTLLRVLDTGELAPLGETSSIRFEAQVVAASQKPLSELVAAGRFRDDLAARLSGLVVRLPPLRERRADIPRLFDVLLRERSGGTSPPVSTRLYESLCLRDWPGNVRELELLARQLLAVRGFEPLLRRSHLPESMLRALDGKGAATDAGSQVDRNQRDLASLALALKSAGGNVQRAATMVGISRQRAYRLIGGRLGELAAAARPAAGEPGDDPDE